MIPRDTLWSILGIIAYSLYIECITQLPVLWSRGMTLRCGRSSPGSNPGSASFLPLLDKNNVLFFAIIVVNQSVVLES